MQNNSMKSDILYCSSRVIVYKDGCIENIANRPCTSIIYELAQKWSEQQLRCKTMKVSIKKYEDCTKEELINVIA